MGVIRGATGKPIKAMGLKLAIEHMNGRRNPGHERSKLMNMKNNASPDGSAFYVVPGGYVEPETAQRIIGRPDVKPQADGLLPECPQTWVMV